MAAKVSAIYTHWTRKVRWQMDQALAARHMERYRKLYRKLNGGLYRARASRKVKRPRVRPLHPRQPFTQCKRGHEFTEENTYINTNGAQVCRICRRESKSEKRKQEKRRSVRLTM